jgi:FO synthase
MTAPDLSDDEALVLANAGEEEVAALMALAAKKRDDAWGGELTFSPKVFLPLTNLCRNFCDYCSFRRSPGQAGEWTMTPEQVVDWLDQAAAQGAGEALLCLGDHPETEFESYAELLAKWGFSSTVDYLVWASERALERGLLPHTNAGLLDRTALKRLRPLNVSFGLMLESIAERLCEKGGPHEHAPDKRPSLRMDMMRVAGELRIPFTTGILIGIGDTRVERVESLLAIRKLHEQSGHIQEVIVQNFTARPRMRLRDQPEPEELELAHAVAMARLILPSDVSVQAPPNLNPQRTEMLIRAGVNDFGGISAVSPDYINPSHPWPGVETLAAECATQGFRLRPRSPLYDGYLKRPDFLDAGLVESASRVSARFADLAETRAPWMLTTVEDGGAPDGLEAMPRGSAAVPRDPDAVVTLRTVSRVEGDPVAQ